MTNVIVPEADLTTVPLDATVQAKADQTMAQVGTRIRTLRSQQGLTLKDVGARTGVSVSMLSMLERGVAKASIGTLVSVASALGVHMYDLFDRPEAEPTSPLTKKKDQATVRTNKGAVRRIVHHDAVAGVELAVNEYAAGGASGPVLTHHDGREVGVLISGALRLEIEGESYLLQPGDAIAYASTRPHRISNAGDGPAVAVWVNIDKR